MNPTRDELLAVIRELAEKAVPIVAQRNSAYAGGGDVFGNLNLIETLSSGDIRTETGTKFQPQANPSNLKNAWLGKLSANCIRPNQPTLPKPTSNTLSKKGSCPQISLSYPSLPPTLLTPWLKPA
jgi:hypothetical protein